MIKKLLAGMAIVFCTSVAFAANYTNVDVSGLTDAQVAQLKAQAAKVVADNANKVTEPAAQVSTIMQFASTWGTQAAQAAEGFAKALGIAAKELNITINDFLKSDAGKLTAAVIIWKIAGPAFIHAMYGILFVTIGLILSRVLYLRLFTKGYEKVTYNRFFGMFKGEKMVRIPKTIHELENDGEWLVLWVTIGIAVLSVLVGGVYF